MFSNSIVAKVLLALSVFAGRALAQQDEVNVAVLVEMEGAPIARTEVVFVDTDESLITDNDGYVLFTRDSGYFPKDSYFNITIDALGVNRQFLTPSCFDCSEYEVAAYYLNLTRDSDGDGRGRELNLFGGAGETETVKAKPREQECVDRRRLGFDEIIPEHGNIRGLQGGGAPAPDGAKGPYFFKPWSCGDYHWRLDAHEDLACQAPNGAELNCATYVNGKPTGPASVDREIESEVKIEAKISSEVGGKLGNFGLKVGSSSGGSRRVTSKQKVTTTIGETEFPGKCGEVCVRTKIKKITLRKWKKACWCNEAGWWTQWSPTGVKKDYEIVTGYCHDVSELTDC